MTPAGTWNGAAIGGAPAGRARPPLRRIYRAVLAWTFTLCNTLRVVFYLPTVWTIHASGSSSQHSLWTWAVFCAGNLTMAAWLYEEQARWTRTILVSVANAAMCALIVVVIAWYR